MTIHGEGNNGGDPNRYCDELTVRAGDWHEARTLAALFRVLRDPAKAGRLFEAVREIESGTPPGCRPADGSAFRQPVLA